jgi:hypothetical protein
VAQFTLPAARLTHHFRAKLLHRRSRCTEAEQRLFASVQKFADVGERLIGARAGEALLQQQISVLTNETARLMAGPSQTETWVQKRQETQRPLCNRSDVGDNRSFRITAERDALSQELQTTAWRRDLLAEDAATATEQRQSEQAVNALLSEGLAARSQQLAEVERRMDVLASRETTINDSELTLKPGGCTDSPLSMTLGDDGGFVLRNDTRGEEITGTYAVNEGLPRLSEGSGNAGETPFPMTCALRRSADGLVLETAEDQLCAVSGLKLQAAE